MACENPATHMVKRTADPHFIPACASCAHEAREAVAASDDAQGVEIRPATKIEQRYPCLIGEESE